MENNRDSLNDNPNLPLYNSGKNQFGLPDGYFLKFEEKLKQKIELESEFSEFPALSSVKKVNPFVAPANYFQVSENSISHEAELMLYPQLSAAKKINFSNLQNDYERQLHSELNYKIQLVDELKIYKKLYTLDKTNSFGVTENYFENISEQIKSRIFSVKQPEKSILNSVLDFIFGKSMAVSFSVIFIICLSVYFNRADEAIVDTGDCKTLACLEKQEIVNSKALANFDEDQLMDLVDVNLLNEQLDYVNEDKIQEQIILDSIKEEELIDQL